LHLVGYLYYWQMGFNSVFKGLIAFQMRIECRRCKRSEQGCVTA